ncbi:MAG: TonB-dependent receptor [Gammaproteobacteria bacterium]|nr:TonB-dependent receptor [Gammaproteobacteria bacterium]
MRLAILVLGCSWAWGATNAEPRYDIDIPSLDAAEALTRLAEQTDTIVLFPYDLAQGRQANEVVGRFTLTQAVEALLRGTGIAGSLSDKRVLQISLDGTAEPGNTEDGPMEEPEIERRPLLRRIGATLAAVLVTSPGVAQDAEEPATRITEEIIVTAERREENILKVPMSMTAFNDIKIDELGIQNAMDLEQLVPGLQFGDPTEGLGHGTTMRGMGTARGGDKAGVDISRDEAVATYVDGVFTFAEYGLDAHLFDLERIEVLRGPQGTMFGRNAIGGAINYYTKKPTDEWDALVIAEVTDQMTQRVNVAFGGPLSDHFSFRITGGYYVGDGAQENIGFGGDYDAPDQRSISPQLRFKTDRLDINLRYGYVEDTGAPRTPISISDRVRDVECAEFPGLTYSALIDGCHPNNWYLYEGSVPSIDPNCPPNVVGFKCGKLKNITNVNAPGIQDSHRETVIAYAMFDLTETLTLRYNFGLADILQSSSRDNDNTNRVSSAQDVSLASDGLVPFINDRQENFFPYEETSHELQLLSNFDGPFNFVSGIFYYDVENAWDMEIDSFSTTFRFLNADEAAQAVGFGGCQEMLELFGLGIESRLPDLYFTCPPGSDHTHAFELLSRHTSETRAAFFSADYRIDEHWLVSGGLRYSKDTKDRPGFDGSTTIGIAGVPVLVFFDISNLFGHLQPGETVSWDKTIGHIGVEYTPVENRLFYGRLSTGYRAGSFNYDEGSPNTPPVPTDPVEEETNINYELGVKGIFADDRLRLTAAVYYNDIENYQILLTQEVPPGFLQPHHISPNTEYTANVDGTELSGFELSAEYRLNEQWRVDGYYNFQDSSLGPHSAAIRGNPDNDFLIHEYVTLAGEPMSRPYPAPEDVTGNRLPMQPTHKAALTLVHERPLTAGGRLQLLSTLSYTGSRYPDIGNLDFYKMPAYERWDLRARWTSANDAWSVTAYVQNLTDEIGLVQFVPVSYHEGRESQTMGTLTDPRRFGLQVRWQPRF